MKIVFFGTPDFAATILEKLIANGIEVVAIVTRPDRPQGRSLKVQASAVKVKASKLLPSCPIFQPEKCSTDEFVKVLQGIQADLYVVVAFGEIVSQQVLDLPPLGCINVHASLLPKYRGAAPIHRAIMNGEKESGISIIRMVKKMDAGDIFYSEKVFIPVDMTFGELESVLCELGSKCLLKVISDISQQEVHAQEQDHALATFAPKITTEECQIDWKKPADIIHNLIRGTSPHPGAWCMAALRTHPKRVKILRSERFEAISGKPGEIVQHDKNSLIVACGSGSIRLLEVQVEGKPSMPVSELLKGIRADEIHFFG